MGVTDTLWRWTTFLDHRLTLFASRFWNLSYTFNACMVIIAKYTPIIMLGILVIAASDVLPTTIPPQLSTWSVASSIISALLIRGLHEPVSRSTHRPRPFDTFVIAPLLQHEPGDSFPSNHAAGAFALALGAEHLPGYFPILLALAFLLAFSRFYCGLHHLSDVIVGAAGGAVAGDAIATLQVSLHLVS